MQLEMEGEELEGDICAFCLETNGNHAANCPLRPEAVDTLWHERDFDLYKPEDNKIFIKGMRIQEPVRLLSEPEFKLALACVNECKLRAKDIDLQTVNPVVDKQFCIGTWATQPGESDGYRSTSQPSNPERQP